MDKCGKSVWEEVKKDMGGCGRVYEVSGQVCWGVGEVKGDEERFWFWGPNTLPFTSPSGPLFPPTPQHALLYLFPHLPSPSQSVAKLPPDKVSGNHEYYVQYVYGHFNTTCIENNVKIDKSVICRLLQWWIFLHVSSFMFFKSGNTMVMFNFCTFE